METDALEMSAREAQRSRQNTGVWAGAVPRRSYATRQLRPVERRLLHDYREGLSGSVLELGCGAGRLTGHLLDIAQTVHGIDLSPAMLTYCRREYPRGIFTEQDLRDLSGFSDASFGVVLAPFNVLDVLNDAERRRVLRDIVRLLVPRGLLLMSTHNRHFEPFISGPGQVFHRNPTRLAFNLLRLPRRLHNRRRLLPLQRHEREYAVLVDDAHDFSLLHYYISAEAQDRQLRACGFELLECLSLDGQNVEPGQTAARCPELHYAARALSEHAAPADSEPARG